MGILFKTSEPVSVLAVDIIDAGEAQLSLGNLKLALCISFIVGKSPSRSEHLNRKTATISTFFQGLMMILHEKIPY